MSAWPGVAMVVALALGAGTAPGREPLLLELRRQPTQLSDAVATIDRACSESRRVAVRVVSADEVLDLRFECARIQADRPTAIQADLVHGVEDFHNAGKRADRVVAVDRALPSADRVGHDRDAMVWSFAGKDPLTCARARQPGSIRRNMATAAAASGESPERWTMVEAVLLAGACPERLPDLYRNVRRIGEGEAARAVERRIERALQSA